MSIAPLRKKYLGEILLAQNLITKEQLSQSLAEQKTSKQRLGAILVKKGFITEQALMKALAASYGMPLTRLTDVNIEGDALRALSEKMARRFCVLPISVKGSVLKIATADPSNVAVNDEIAMSTGLKVSAVLSTENEIKDSIERYYGGRLVEDSNLEQDEVAEIDDADDTIGEGEEGAEAAPIIRYVNALLFQAVNKKASDIHIEPQEKVAVLRMRLDGRLIEFPPPPQKFYSAIVSRVKIMANLDIAERRLPQDGKCKLKVGDKKIDVRVSTLPTIYGEKVVMRVLDRSNVSLRLDDMGVSESDMSKLKEAFEAPFGMILVTGPTGSGKTTTLYTGINYINRPDVNIVTAEDPVEYELKKINQVQVKPQIGLTFAGILRSVLRQDPDVIMVGEIRDRETAEIAIQSALTGHLVLSTLHTNDAVSSLSRLRYMGIESFLVADAVNLVVAQRLVRKICPGCKQEQDIPQKIFMKLGIPEGERPVFYHGKGCDKCFGSGYKGRTAIMEILSLSPAIRQMLMSETDDIKIKEQAVKEGMRTLRDQALDKLRDGITTVEEVISVTSAN